MFLGQWTVMDSKIIKSFMRTVRTRYAKGFRKSLSITVHCPFFGLGIASHRPLHHLHLISLPADDDIASDALIFHTSEALIG